MRTHNVLTLLLAAAVLTPAQTMPQFDVISVKPARQVPRSLSAQQPGGRLVATNVTARALMQIAYAVQGFQISGGPEWWDSAGYDLVAQPEIPMTPGPDNAGEFRQMLRGLLMERFHLSVRRNEQKETVYALVAPKGGQKMKAAEKPEDPRQIRISGGLGRMDGQRVLMATLAQSLGSRLGMRVTDEMGLTGYYDFQLEWTPDEPGSAQGPVAGGAGPNRSAPCRASSGCGPKRGRLRLRRL